MRENEKVLVLSREKEWGRSSRVGEKEERDRREREREMRWDETWVRRLTKQGYL
jgi:hypothetical protein